MRPVRIKLASVAAHRIILHWKIMEVGEAFESAHVEIAGLIAIAVPGLIVSIVISPLGNMFKQINVVESHSVGLSAVFFWNHFMLFN